MANRESSKWWCKNEKARDVLKKFVEDLDSGAEVHEEGSDILYLSWDNWVYDEIVESLDMSNYVHSRSDEFANYFYYCIGEEIFDGENMNHNQSQMFDEWWVFKNKNRYVSKKRLMEMKDDFFKGIFRKYPDEYKEYIESFSSEADRAKQLLTDNDNYYYWLSRRGIIDD